MDWYHLNEQSEELGALWDECTELPRAAGTNPTLDAFCERKGLSIPDLLRIGTRLTDSDTLAFAHPTGIKTRHMGTGRRSVIPLGATFPRLKIIPGSRYQGGEPSSVGPDARGAAGDQPAPADSADVILAEGETDGAWLAAHYRSTDVAILPAGARRFTAEMTEQLGGYARVLVGTDNDDSGEAGFAKVAELLPQAVRFRPPWPGDWCSAPADATPPPITEAPRPVELFVSGEDMDAMEMEEAASYYEGGLLPVGGLLVLHGWIKSFKSFVALDLMAQLAQGNEWCHFAPTEEAVKVGVVQWEIRPQYYRKRWEGMKSQAVDLSLLRRNFFTLTPDRRPSLTAGNKVQEDQVLRAVERLGLQVLLVDPVKRFVGFGNMNLEEEARRALMFFERLNNEGVTVVAVHHDSKTGARAGGGDPMAAAGAGGWVSDADTIISISLPKGEDPIRSKRRNMAFTLRNGPGFDPRGYEAQGEDEEVRICYQTERWEQPDANTPSEASAASVPFPRI